MKKAIFLDKDGTLIRNIPYNVEPALIQLLPGVCEGLYQLQTAGYRLIVVSNQPGIALGYFTEADLMPVASRIWELLAAEGIHADAFYYCPHAPEGPVRPYSQPCGCRKPQPGLLLRAARDFGIYLPDSWMIGDILDDVEAGKRAGCRSILIDNGNETEWELTEWRQPDHAAMDIREAAGWILQDQEKEHEHFHVL